MFTELTSREGWPLRPRDRPLGTDRAVRGPWRCACLAQALVSPSRRWWEARLGCGSPQPLALFSHCCPLMAGLPLLIPVFPSLVGLCAAVLYVEQHRPHARRDRRSRADREGPPLAPGRSSSARDAAAAPGGASPVRPQARDDPFSAPGYDHEVSGFELLFSTSLVAFAFLPRRTSWFWETRPGAALLRGLLVLAAIHGAAG